MCAADSHTGGGTLVKRINVNALRRCYAVLKDAQPSCAHITSASFSTTHL